MIERLAIDGNPSALKFTRPKISDGRPDFSFSGLKTALSKYLKSFDVSRSDIDSKQFVSDVAASFQSAVVTQLADTTAKAARDFDVKTLIVAGGVACNMALRSAMQKVGSDLSIPVYFPSKHLSTDNAAMIAAAAYAKFQRGEHSAMNMTADVTLRLQNVENADAELRGKVKYRL